MKTASTCIVMAAFSAGDPSPPTNLDPDGAQVGADPSLVITIQQRFQSNLGRRPGGLTGVAQRMAEEVDRICRSSDRIKPLGMWCVAAHLTTHRIEKCLTYYRLGSEQGRVDLHSSLSAIVYRHVAPADSYLSFQGRYSLLEDFMQTFYIEVLNAFRREHHLPPTYTPAHA